MEDLFMIPPKLFNEVKAFIFIGFSFCEKKIKFKNFIKKIHLFTNVKNCISINWITKKIKSLFLLKDMSIYPSCKVYCGLCSRKKNYIGESNCNMMGRIQQPNQWLWAWKTFIQKHVTLLQLKNLGKFI